MQKLQEVCQYLMESCKFFSAAILCVSQIVTYEKETGYKASEDTIVHALIVAAVASEKHVSE